MYAIDRRGFLKVGATGAAAVAAGPMLLGSCARPGVPPAMPAAAPPRASYFADGFGVDEDLLRRVLARALERGGDFAEVFCQHKTGDFIGFEDEQVNRAYTSVDLGAGVRVLLGDQTGYAFTEDLDEESLLTAAATAAAIASGAPAAGPESLAPVAMPRMYETRRLWVDTPPADKIGIVERVGKGVLAGDPAVIKAQVHFAAQDEVILVANSDGLLVEDTRPLTHLYATCVARKNGVIESNSYSRSLRDGPALYSPELIAELSSEAVKRTLLLFEARVPDAGAMPVVLAPATSGILLHEAMGHGFEADFNRKETSIFSTMMGREIAGGFVTIVDTALDEKGRGAINIDDEGTPGQETVLVENGRLKSYLHDRISAKHYGVAPTGNGRRQDFRHVPLPRMRVTTMENGPHDPEEILRSVKRGIYAVDFANGEVAIGAGDYSFYVKTGFLIEDGRLTSPIKDVNLIGNGPDSLAKVEMVGNDKALDSGTWTCGKAGQRVPVGLGLPTVKVSSITVGGVNQ